jgi:hypothetical protein
MFGTLRKLFRTKTKNIPKRFGTIPKAVKKSLFSHTERVPNHLENVRNNGDEVPNSSEARTEHSETLPKKEKAGTEVAKADTERVRNPTAEQYRTAPICSDQHAGCSITVRAAARIFEETGVPRTERAITNWCNRNTRGITRLDCCYNNEERKYYITPESIDRVIKEERKKIQYIEFKDGNTRSMEAEDDSEALRNEEATDVKTEVHGDHVQSSNSDRDDGSRSERTDRTADTTPPEPRSKQRLEQEHVEEDHARLKELQMENYELRVQLEGQKHLIRQFDSLVDGERERHEREKLALVDRLTDARHQVGSLEQKLLQLEAPRESVRDAEIEERREVR